MFSQVWYSEYTDADVNDSGGWFGKKGWRRVTTESCTSLKILAKRCEGVTAVCNPSSLNVKCWLKKRRSGSKVF